MFLKKIRVDVVMNACMMQILNFGLVPHCSNQGMHRWIIWVWFGGINHIAKLKEFA
jgi:hypothetical protein